MGKRKIALVLLALMLAAAIGAFAWMWYDSHKDRSGWEERDGNRYYHNFEGKAVTLWQDIEGSRYYFGTDGVMATLWQDIDGSRYYFGTDGAMVTQWQNIDGGRYYFASDGKLHTGWLELEGKHYYLPEGALVTGWQMIQDTTYYFDSEGILLTGDVEVDGITYHLGEDGSLTVGWQGNLYYLCDGTMATGWQDIDGKRYYFREDGTMFTGWLEEGEYRYYLQHDGSAAVGPVEIDGKLWHFTPKGIQIYLVNSKNKLGDDYTVELTQVDGYRVAVSCSDALARMLADCRAEGLYPTVINGYRTYWDQRYMYNNLLNAQGEIAKLYCAEPNASEHQLGLAVDIVEYSYRTLNASQENTKTFRWFSEHCWDYGFIVRYPNGSTDITGIAYEPWHYRYVGTEVSLDLKEQGVTLEEYLGAA